MIAVAVLVVVLVPVSTVATAGWVRRVEDGGLAAGGAALV
jgi:hypothetical protein